MGGGLLQLVAYGAQDVYLTGNPQITFFKGTYKRHTNFAIESIEQTFNGNVGFGSRVTCQISRNGDLINRVYLQLKLTNTDAADSVYCKYFGLRVINYVEIEIGGQKIDKHYAHWLYIWNELSLPKAKRDGYNEMVGAYGGIVNYAANASKASIKDTLYVPLEFWFCRNVGLALPLIALQYHEVKLNINFEQESKLKVTSDKSPSFTASLWVDYIFLDTDERRRFAQLSHEYLIEQLQFTGEEAVTSTSVKAKLNFNHPCKELVWFLTNNKNDNNNWFNYTTTINSVAAADFGTDKLAKKLMCDGLSSFANGTITERLYPSNPVKDAKLVLNGNDRFAVRTGNYFNVVQPYQHHENVPANAGINVYSFALKPEEHQPSGTLNMSRIDTAVLNLNIFNEPNKLAATDIVLPKGQYSSADSSLLVYATNYNVLRILSGMGGLAYSN
jgi:hypothetical protein